MNQYYSSKYFVKININKRQRNEGKNTRKTLSIFAVLTIFASLAIGCDRSSPNKIGKDQYYVRIKGEGEVKDRERFYTLPGYDENGTEKKITFTSVKNKNDKLKENAFLRLYVTKEDKAEVTYEQVIS